MIAQTLTLQQDGTTVTGKAPLTVYGVDCDFTGTAGPNNISLKTSRCSPLLTPTVGLPSPARAWSFVTCSLCPHQRT